MYWKKYNRNCSILVFFCSKILFWYSENGWKQIIKNQYDKFIFLPLGNLHKKKRKFKFIFSFFFELKFFSTLPVIYLIFFTYDKNKKWQYVIVTYFHFLVFLYFHLLYEWKKILSSYENIKKIMDFYLFTCSFFFFYFTNSSLAEKSKNHPPTQR